MGLFVHVNNTQLTKNFLSLFFRSDKDYGNLDLKIIRNKN